MYEQKRTKHLVLITRLRLAGEIRNRALLRTVLPEALEKKYPERSNLFRRADFLLLPDGDVYLHCAMTECITVEGSTRTVFDAVNKAVGFHLPKHLQIDPSKPPNQNHHLDASRKRESPDWRLAQLDKS